MKTQILVSIKTLIFLSSPILFNAYAYGQDLAQAVIKKREMVVTANPLATAAGERVLRQGGTAADAMIAAQTVLSLVEPQASGIGGGAFVVYYDARSGKTITVDAREKAPSAATQDRFQDLSFFQAWQSGLSVGVPGVPRMMEFMHKKYGRLPMRRLFRPAVKLAENGYPLTQRTSDQVARLLSFNPSCEERLFLRDENAFEYFANPDCSAKPAGTVVTNPAYADTLKQLQRYGSYAFYNGPIAADIVAAVQGDPAIPGDMTEQDLANYDVVVRRPVCSTYRGRKVCGMGPPSSGGLAVGQILGILENFDFADKDPLDVDVVHLFTQAGRLAFADRNRYVGDPDFVTVPSAGMLNKEYLSSRAALIGENDMGTAEAGVPPGIFDTFAPDMSTIESGTSHVSIIDRYGNALSMTTTVEASLGNGVMVRGFMLNNQLTDFSFAATDAEGLPVANRVEGDKRPRSSMSPTIIYDKRGRVEFLTGSPGGSRIIGYTAQSIVNLIDFELDPQETINVPHYMNRNGRTDIEQPITGITWDYDAQSLADELKLRGHSDPNLPLDERSVGIISQTSGLSIIQVAKRKRPRHFFDFYWRPKKVLIGGADKRRDRTVGGR